MPDDEAPPEEQPEDDEERPDERPEEPEDDEAAPLTLSQLRQSLPANRLGPLVLGALAFMMVGFIVGRVSSDTTATDAGEGGSPTATTAFTIEFPLGDQDRSGYWGLGGVTPAVADDFARDDGDTLGGPPGRIWDEVAGSWEVTDGTAAGAPSEDGPAIAVLSGGPAERLTEATATTVEAGAGILSRYRNPQNHWSLTADPEESVWRLTKVVDGESEEVAELAADTADGVTATVAQRGAELQFLFDGFEVMRVDDPALRGERLSGLIVPEGGDGSARFDRFYIGAMP